MKKMGKNKKQIILVVDDNLKNLQLIGNILINERYELVMALNGSQALKYVEKEKPNLILLDIMMSEMSGYEVCRKLKAKKDTKDIPVIFITAKIEEKDLLEGFKCGAVDYIRKPFNLSELLARIDTHIKLNEATKKIKLQQEEIIKEAHDRGFIEVVSGLVHNLANIMSTLYFNMEEFVDCFEKEEKKEMSFFENILTPELLKIENKTENLEKITEVLPKLLNLIRESKNENIKKLKCLEKKIVSINDIVHLQQNLFNGLGTEDYYNMQSIVESVLRLYAETIEKKDIKIISNFNKVDDILCNKDQMIRILGNVIKNGYEELELSKKGEKILKISIYEKDEKLIISIKDNGRGISDKIKDQMFDFGFSTKNNAKGYGLYSSSEIIKRYNGSIKIRTIPNEETEVLIIITQKKRKDNRLERMEVD